MKEPHPMSHASRLFSTDNFSREGSNSVNRPRDDSNYSNRYPKEEYSKYGRDFRNSVYNSDYQGFPSEYGHPPMTNGNHPFANGPEEERMEPDRFGRNNRSIPGHRRKVNWNIKKDDLGSDPDV